MEANKVTDYDWEVEKCFHDMIEIKKGIVSKVHHNIKEAQAHYKKDFEKKHQQKEVKLN